MQSCDYCGIKGHNMDDCYKFLGISSYCKVPWEQIALLVDQYDYDHIDKNDLSVEPHNGHWLHH